MGAVIDPKDDEAAEPRIDELARALAAEINRGEASGRTDLRDLAIGVLRSSVDTRSATDAADELEGGAAKGAQALNPFALGIPLLLVGPFLGFLFPPVGILLFLLGLVSCLIGMVLAIGRTTAARWRQKASDRLGETTPTETGRRSGAVRERR